MNLLVLVVTIVALLVTVDALFGGLANKKASSTVGKKVVVLGGTGFVGSRITQQLSEGGNKVIAISRSGEIPEWAQS